MLEELVKKAEELEREGKLIPYGFTRSSEPIKWVVHIYPDKRIYVEEYAGENRPRASLSKRSGTTTSYPYPFADESAYVLGIELQKKGGKDRWAAQKHRAYLKRLDEMINSPYFAQPLFQEAIRLIKDKIKDGSIKEVFKDKGVFSKDWITFVYEKGELAGRHLHELDETKAFWQERVLNDVAIPVTQQCSVCGRETQTVTNLPTKVNLFGSRRQIASFNENAFVSHRFSDKNAPLGICVTCAENASQAVIVF